ncbi:hypothetical protein [Sphingomonas sp. MMS24-J13]|uniref:hypothetical protein n=1 Tax=Sphingomonas sp. MMS24-J13 TaxID=3238686 RepID=UPI00384AC5EA
MKYSAFLVALATMPAMAMAQSPVLPGCMPQPQAAALVTFALPVMVTKLADRCSDQLPPNSYLEANAGAMADRYAPDSAAAWPTARRAIAQIFSQVLGQPMPAEMNSEMVRTLAEPMLANLLAKQIHRQDCATADTAIADLASLSGRAVGRLAALAVTIADRKGQGIAGVLKVCKAGEDH